MPPKLLNALNKHVVNNQAMQRQGAGRVLSEKLGPSRTDALTHDLSTTLESLMYFPGFRLVLGGGSLSDV